MKAKLVQKAVVLLVGSLTFIAMATASALKEKDGEKKKTK